MFKDRRDAGKRLARELDKYKDKNVLILAIPRGGVEVGYEVSKYLHADFSLLISRKLPYPHNQEAGFGAVAEDGSFFILEEALRFLPEEEVLRIKKEQVGVIKRRIEVLRRGKPLPEIKGRTVILIDDGLAMGSTMRAAVMLCRKKGAGRVVVAVPVAGGDVAREMKRMADETIILEIPEFFQAVAQIYKNWSDVSDREVLSILHKWESMQKIGRGQNKINLANRA